MSKIALSGNASGTGTLTIAAPNTNSDRTLTLPDNSGTVITTASTFAGTGPAFSAYMGSNQTVSQSTWTKLQFNTEEFDTASCYDTATYRFTPNVAGYYQVSANAYLPNANQIYNELGIYKNGSRVKEGPSNSAAGSYVINITCLMYLNGTTDYIELYGQTTGGAPTFGGTSTASFFQAALVRAA